MLRDTVLLKSRESASLSWKATKAPKAHIKMGSKPSEGAVGLVEARQFKGSYNWKDFLYNDRGFNARCIWRPEATLNTYLQSDKSLLCCREKECEKWKYIWDGGSLGPFVCTLSEFLAGLVSTSSLSQIPNSWVISNRIMLRQSMCKENMLTH